MSQAKPRPQRIALDWSKLFGFDQVATPARIIGRRPLADPGLVKIGAKVGVGKNPPTVREA